MLFSSLLPPVSSAQKLDMSEFTDSLNVMLIGHTGVGKTTFINAFQNYLKYPSLDDALTGGLIVPIRTSFNMVIEVKFVEIEVSFLEGSKPSEYQN